jgi:hypothetical protein
MALRRDVAFLFGYACVVGLVVGAVLAISRNATPRRCIEWFGDECLKEIPPTLDEDAVKKKWDRALQHLGM